MTVMACRQTTRNTRWVVANLAALGPVKVFLMTEKTIVWQTAIYATGMTILTIDKAMGPGESEARLIMQEGTG